MVGWQLVFVPEKNLVALSPQPEQDCPQIDLGATGLAIAPVGNGDPHLEAVTEPPWMSGKR